MDSWKNGAKSSEVRRVIDKNFDILDKRTIKINNDILGLNPFSMDFVVSDWIFSDSLKTYIISIPYANYNKTNPCVDVYIKNEYGYSFVCGGCVIKEYGVDLQSDMPYEGRVVIK